MNVIQLTKYTTFFYFFFNNKLLSFLVLAQSFLRAQGLGSAESGIVLLYSEHFGLSRIRRAREKESPKRKTNPIQSQNKAKQSQFFGGFWRKNFNFSLKIDDTKLNFLCKTKPIYKNEQWSMIYQKRQKMQNEPNLNIFLISSAAAPVPHQLGCCRVSRTKKFGAVVNWCWGSLKNQLNPGL